MGPREERYEDYYWILRRFKMKLLLDVRHDPWKVLLSLLYVVYTTVSPSAVVR